MRPLQKVIDLDYNSIIKRKKIDQTKNRLNSLKI
jgi:hypothetical protein